MLISIITSIVVGYATCALMFPTIHILTFVFSTTIIGVCIDYSLHFFIEKNESNNSEEVIKKIPDETSGNFMITDTKKRIGIYPIRSSKKILFVH